VTPRGTPVGYNIYDLLTRVVPGAIGVGSLIVSTSSLDALYQVLGSTPQLILFGTTSLIIGEAINLFRAHIAPIPRSFHRVLYEEFENPALLGRRDRFWRRVKNDPDFSVYDPFLTTNKEFWETFESQFDLSSDNVDPILSYNTLVSFMEPYFSGKLARYRATFLFVQNTILSCIASIGIIIFTLIAVNSSSLEQYLAFLILVLVLSHIVALFQGIERAYVQMLLTEYHAQMADRSSI